MSPTMKFDDAALGRVQSEGVITDCSILGIKAGEAGPAILAACIGDGLQNGHINLTNAAIEAKAAKVDTVMPGGGLAAKGGEQSYVYKGGDMFMSREM